MSVFVLSLVIYETTSMLRKKIILTETIVDKCFQVLSISCEQYFSFLTHSKMATDNDFH